MISQRPERIDILGPARYKQYPRMVIPKELLDGTVGKAPLVLNESEIREWT